FASCLGSQACPHRSAISCAWRRRRIDRLCRRTSFCCRVYASDGGSVVGNLALGPADVGWCDHDHACRRDPRVPPSLSASLASRTDASFARRVRKAASEKSRVTFYPSSPFI